MHQKHKQSNRAPKLYSLTLKNQKDKVVDGNVSSAYHTLHYLNLLGFLTIIQFQIAIKRSCPRYEIAGHLQRSMPTSHRGPVESI